MSDIQTAMITLIRKANLNTIVEICYQEAKANGWDDREIPIPEQIALLHSEVSEALECYRNNEALSWVDEMGKPQGLGSEFADILIRLGHYAAKLKIDLEYQVAQKLEYNRRRGYRHGDKKC